MAKLAVGRMIFQECARLKIPWDSAVPSDVRMQWSSWVKSLQDIDTLMIPRCLQPGFGNDATHELHCFSDASTKAYGCCIYLRTLDQNGRILCTLVCSKARLAPLKSTMTVPRLELQAAFLCAQLEAKVRSCLTLNLKPSQFWSDSSIVIAYIKNEQSRFQVFVANRVSVIRKLTNPEQWSHIRGEDNPSDFLTRGVTVQNLDRVKWLHGPAFLSTHRGSWKSSPSICLAKPVSLMDLEVKKGQEMNVVTCAANAINEEAMTRLITHYSSWYRLKKAVAYYVKLAEIKAKGNTVDMTLTACDLLYAEKCIIRYEQQRFFDHEVRALKAGRSIKRSSHIVKLLPYINDDKLLAVGGRLQHSNLDLVMQHQIIIPHKSPIAKLILKEAHDTAHCGREWVLALSRKRYWVTRARKIVDQLIKDCVICRRLYGKPMEQVMAPLPEERVTSSTYPFLHVGTDIFGPYLVKNRRSEEKRYGCLYTCMKTRAVHIEMISSLQTDSFLNGLMRFVSLRGAPKKIWSDCGTNLVGAKNELQKSMRDIDQNQVNNYCRMKDIQWHFNPPGEAHQGGIWERVVKTVKRAMNALLRDTPRLNDEILSTVFAEIANLVNSRPIVKSSDDPQDPVLTPNHLLLMRHGALSPPGSFTTADVYKRRWRHCQHIVSQFWKRWLACYIPELQRRSKWLVPHRNIAVGDVVLINNKTPRGLWPLAVVTKISVGRDGHVRSATLRTKSGVLVRPITTLVLLECS